MNSDHYSDEHLSTCLDGELRRDQQEQTALHLAECDSCRERMSEFSAARVAAQAVGSPRVPSEIWSRVSHEIGLPRKKPLVKRRKARSRRFGVIAVATGILFITLLSVLAVQQTGSKRDTAIADRPQLAGIAPFDWGLFLSDLDHPDGRSRLDRTYAVKDASFERALEEMLLSDEVLSENLGRYFEIMSARILESGDARASLLELRDGTEFVYLVIQASNLPVAFSGFRIERDVVRSKPCYSVYCKRFRAVSFTSDGHTYTIVAARNSRQPGRLVSLIAG